MTRSINVSHRELTYTIGRALHAAGIAGGAVNPVRDVLVDAQALGVDVLTVVLEAIPSLPARNGAVAWRADGDKVLVDGGGQPAFLIAPAVLDLGVALAVRRGSPTSLVVTGATRRETLRGLEGRGHLYGVAIEVELAAGDPVSAGGPPATGQATVTVRPQPATRTSSALEGSGPHIAALLTRGTRIEAGLWWRFYDFSNDSLTPDSDLSRRHAGASVIDSQGRIVGEIGEDDEHLEPAGLRVAG